MACLVSAAPGPNDPPKEKKPEMGTWQLVWANGLEGRDLGDPEFEEFTADGHAILRTSSKGELHEARRGYTVDWTATPAKFNFVYGSKAPPTEGIVKIEGDILTLCYETGLGERPKEFTQVGLKTSLFVYKRVKPKG